MAPVLTLLSTKRNCPEELTVADSTRPETVASGDVRTVRFAELDISNWAMVEIPALSSSTTYAYVLAAG